MSQELFRAAEDGRLEDVKKALQGGVDIESRDMFGDTALNKAAEGGHLEVVRFLVDRGADIHNAGGADKTPVKNAAFAGHIPVVRLLLEKGAKIDNDLLSSVQMKIGILEENAANGMVKPEACEAWKVFLDYLLKMNEKRNP